MTRRIVTVVTEILDLAPGVKQFRLERAAGGPLPSFSAGAHIVVEVTHRGRRFRNPYSLTSPPWQTASYTLGVWREEKGRGGSCYLHDLVGRGTELQITAPANLFPAHAPARKHLLVAGGIGITPFVAMAAELDRQGCPFELHYASRSRASAAYAATLLSSYAGRVFVYGSAEGEKLPLRALLRDQLLGTHLYVCGPARLTDDVMASAQDAGWPVEHLHTELFTPRSSGAPFAVCLARSQRTLHVGPEETLLEALEAAGVEVPFLCRFGACGLCETPVLFCRGRLLHADHVLTEGQRASGTSILPCVSRFQGETIILDL